MQKLKLVGVVGYTMREQVDKFLDGLEEDEEFELIASSPGGSVTEGLHIYNSLKDYKFTAKVISHASSMMSVIIMAAEKIVMERGALMLIHNPRQITFGDNIDHKRSTETLENARESLIDIYLSRKKLKLSREELGEIMDKDIFHNGKQLKKMGFVDEVVGEIEEKIDVAAMSSQFQSQAETAANNEYIHQYMKKLNSFLTEQGINGKNDIPLNTNREGNEMPNDELVAQVSTLKAQKENLEAKLEETKSNYTKLQDDFTSLQDEKKELDNSLQEKDTELKAANEKLSELEKTKISNEIDKVISENDNRLTKANADYYKKVLAEMKNDGKEDLYNETVKHIKAMPKLDLKDEKAPESNEDKSKEGLESIDFSKVENWDNATVNAYNKALVNMMRKNPDMTEAEAEAKLMGGK